MVKRKKDLKFPPEDFSCPRNCGHDDSSWCNIPEKPKIRSKMKNKWIQVPHKDLNYWLGEYLLSSMVLQSYREDWGFPDRIGKIKDSEDLDGGLRISFEATWDR